MELGGALGRPAAAFDGERRRAEVADEMCELGRNVARVEIDNQGLHLQDLVGACLAVLGDRAGDDIESRTLAPRPGGEGFQLVEGRGVGFDPDVVGFAVPALALVDEAANRDQALAIAEDHIQKYAELSWIRLDAERILLRGRVVEITPRVEVDHFAGGLVVTIIAHWGSLQQRSAQEHIRHSK